MKKLFSLLVIFISLTSSAQQLEVKYGKVTNEELEMKECSFYPEAESMILAESGDLGFVYNNTKGWQYVITVIKRIKIFNYQDKDLANIKLVVYDPINGTNREDLSGIKAITYNLVDGKVEKTKLTNSEKHSTRISDYRTEVSFAMPNVKEGSVIEFQYTLTSDFISTLQTWHFQNSKPTARSEFRYTLPEFFNYNASQVGGFVNIQRQENTKPETFTFQYETQGQGGASQRETGSLSSISKQVIIVGTDVTPIIDEPYQNNKKNLPGRIEFQLISTKFPNSTMKMIATDYDSFNKTLIDNEGIGRAINKGNFAKDFIATLSSDPTERAVGIYNWIQGHFSFNDQYGVSSQKAGKPAFNEGIGSVPDINLSLVAAYREAGLNAYPVLLSTRGHGIPHPVYPNFEDFNYVIAALLIGDQIYLTDATSGMPFGMLPTRCLNDKGWMASETKGDWVDLKSKAKHAVTLLSQIQVSDEAINTAHEVKFSQYAAPAESKKLKEDQDEYEQKISSFFSEHEFSNFNSESSDTDLKLTFQVSKETDNADIIYLQPVNYLAITENPFKREDRHSPIDFSLLESRKIMVKIELPDGYTAELPEKTIVSLPGNAGRFTYTINQMGNQITVMSLFDLNKSVFLPEEYTYLKQFYELVAKKHSEMIVLKRI